MLHNDSKNKQERVLDELDSADRLILIETPNSHESPWVNLELERAKLLKKKIFILPFKDLEAFLNKDGYTNLVRNERWLSSYEHSY